MTFDLRPPRHLPVRALLALVWLIASAARAQSPTPPSREPYRLAIADVIEVVVLGEPDLSTVPPGIEVGPDGRIGLPYLGMVVAEGKTCDELAGFITKALSDGRILLDPQVLVRVSQYRASKVNVIGAVRMPGSFAHHPEMDVRDAIALAGGLLLEEGTAASRVRARLIHADGKSEIVKLDEVLEGTGPAPMLQPGDTVVFELEATVSVLGYVAHPGFFRVQDNTRLSAVIAQAGGVGAGPSGVEEGDLRRIVVNRADGAKLEVDLKQVLSGQGGEDPVVRPGDVVYLPPLLQEASVLGYVQAPGRYVFREGDRVSDLLAQAKGALVGTPRGDLTRAVLTHVDGSVRTLDLTNITTGSPSDQDNPALAPGDTLTVPEAQNRAIVSGYVKTPGYYDFEPGETVRTAVARAGGVTPNLGSESSVRVRHSDGSEVLLDLDKDNPALQPGDDVQVPFARHRVAVVGYVSKPGLYEWEKGNTVVDMIAAASGVVLSDKSVGFNIKGGSATRAFLIRQENDDSKVTQLNLVRFFRAGDRSQNPEVEPGDVILVPGKTLFDYERLLRDLRVIPSFLNVLRGK